MSSTLGTSIQTRICPHCKATVSADAQFCTNCGGSLGGRGHITLVGAVLGAMIVAAAIAAYLALGFRNSKTYVPLQEGMAFRYEVNIDKQGVSGYERYTTNAQMQAARQLGGRRVVPRRFTTDRGVTNGSERPSITFYTEDRQGVSAIGWQLGDNGEVKMYDRPAYLLKYPIRVGATWDSWAVDIDARPIKQVNIRSRIDSINEIVTVPAGTFEKCLKVTSRGSEISIIEISNWYAPGVGLIKSIDYRQPRSVLPHRTTVELLEFKVQK